MPRFKHDDKVSVMDGQYTGHTGTISGNPDRIPVAVPTIAGEGRGITEEESVSFVYQVDLDDSKWTVSIAEPNLAHA